MLGHKEDDMKNIALSLRQSNDDLVLIHGKELENDSSKFTLLALLRNEMYFLPSFLTHYRNLGIEKFVFLDDNSSDGSAEFITTQPDTIIVRSKRSYGEIVEIPIKLRNLTKRFRIKDLWRSLLFENFSHNKWTLMVDIDEFVQLPNGMTFPNIVSILEKQKCHSIWGIMLDVYPNDFRSLIYQTKVGAFDLGQPWYFDGEQHIRLRSKRLKPKMIHPGARARLYQTYGVDRLFPLFGIRSKPRFKEQFIRKFFHPSRPLPYNDIWKPVLLKWQKDSYFMSSHTTNIISSYNVLLPILHFRFTGRIYQRIEMALQTKSYYNLSEDYHLMSDLLKTMEVQGGAFTYENSLPIKPFDNFVSTRNAFGVW